MGIIIISGNKTRSNLIERNLNIKSHNLGFKILVREATVKPYFLFTFYNT